jgi:hypothetical protein
MGISGLPLTLENTEGRSLVIAGMSASSFRYESQPERNVALRARIVALAQRHRRYGVGMIHLKLRQGGEAMNYKRVELPRYATPGAVVSTAENVERLTGFAKGDEAAVFMMY